MRKHICYFILLLTITFTAFTGCSGGSTPEPGQATLTTQAGNDKTTDYKSTWENINTLPDHFDRHGADFGAKTEEEYAKMAHIFYENRDKYSVKVDTDGTIRVYDRKTDTFGSYNPDGKTKTFFKPGSTGYWNRQPGKLMGGK